MGTYGCRLRDRRRLSVGCPVQLPGKRAPQADRSDGGPEDEFLFGSMELGSREDGEVADFPVAGEVPFDDFNDSVDSARSTAPKFFTSEVPLLDFINLLPVSLRAASSRAQGSLFSSGSGSQKE